MNKTPKDLETNQRLEEAARWHLLLESETASEADWMNFTLWLEADDQNRAVYDQMEDAIDILKVDSETQSHASQDLGSTTSDVVADKVVALAPRRSFGKLSKRNVIATITSIAAVFLVAINLNPFSAQVETHHYSTYEGGQRQITLTDGTRLHLNVNTELQVSLATDRRETTLLKGEVLFDVTPDRDRPFFVHVGDRDIRVVGTMFNVLRHKGAVTITVAEGIVEVAPVETANDTAPNLAGEQVRLTAGKQLHRRQGSIKSQLSVVDPERVTAWKTGYLAYENALLSRVIEDLNRYFDKQIILSEGAQELRFSGVLDISDQKAILKLLEEVLPIEMVEVDAAITIRNIN